MRALSTAAKRALMAEETGEVFLPLLTISNLGDAQPTLRFVHNTEDIVSRGENYLACPFQMTLPEEREDQLAQVQIVIDNVDRSIVVALRKLQTVARVVLEIVLASSPDVLEAGPFNFSLRDANYDVLTVTGTVMFEDVLNTRYPKDLFTPANTPGLYGAA